MTMFFSICTVLLVACSSMAKQSESEKSKIEKVRVEKHKLRADVKKLKPVKGKDGRERMEEVAETREFPLMFDITEKAQRHKAKRLEKEAGKKGKGQGYGEKQQ